MKRPLLLSLLIMHLCLYGAAPERQALVSVSNKDGIVELVRVLLKNNFKAISTGGIHKLLHESINSPLRSAAKNCPHSCP